LHVHTGGWAINVTVTSILSAGAGARRGTTASSVAGILTRGTAGSCTAGATAAKNDIGCTIAQPRARWSGRDQAREPSAQPTAAGDLPVGEGRRHRRLAGRSARRLPATLSARSLLRCRILLNLGLYLQSKVVMMGEAGCARKAGVVARGTFEGLDVVQFRRDADRGGRHAREVVAALSELDSGVEVGQG